MSELLTAGSRLGPYTILGLLGEGGMGQVYRAHDARLQRDVAIKVLPAAFAADAQRVTRFAREAQTLASFNHPHIAQIYGIESAELADPAAAGALMRALVMELVDGETLADRLRRGPLPAAEALTVAAQVAQALDAAHERGVIHRDLKPSNIAVTGDGVVKVLDFGLAKAADGPADDLSHSPTVLGPTMSGVLLGTAPYMSPEQARGKPVDKRTDIWAFGCVLYEMLTGRRAFAGETTSDTIATILAREPDWSALPDTLPAPVVQLIRRCLEKDPRRRLRDIGDVRFDDLTTAPSLSPVPARTRLIPIVAASAIGGAALAGIVGALWQGFGADTTVLPLWARGSITLSIDAAPSSGPATLPSPSLAVSRDGRSVAWVGTPNQGRPMIWLYSIATGEARALPETEGAAHPFWAPDARALGFQSQGSLRTIDIATGAVRTLASNTEVASGGTWSTDNTIVFTTRYTIDRISASGTDRRVVATLNSDFQENSLRFPRFLPDGRRFLYVARSGRAGNSGAYVGSIDGSPPVRLCATTSHVEYAPPGYLLYVRDSELVARPFDLATLTCGDEIFTVVSRIEASAGGMNGQFAVSENGVLAYLPRSTEVRAVLQWYDRAGRRLEAIGAPAAHASFRLAPDGQRVAVDLGSERLVGRDVWVLNPDGSRTRVTFGGSDDWQPFWAPDGKSVAFMSYRNGVGDLFVKSLDGTGVERQLLAPAGEPGPDEQKVPGDWSPDGKLVAFWSERPETRGDVWVQAVDGTQKAMAIARTSANERRPRFSPDGRFVAYESDATGTSEIFVQPVPPTGGKWQISVGGGTDVAWRADGGELYFMDRKGMLTAVPVTTRADGFSTASPVPLFSLGDRPTAGGSIRFEPSRDGRRFLVRDVVSPPLQPISVMVNWPARLTRR